jgi:hypothetical protein
VKTPPKPGPDGVVLLIMPSAEVNQAMILMYAGI